MRKQHGFSLIETIIALGLMGAVVLGMATLMSTQQKSLKMVEQKQEITSLKTSMQQILGLANSCSWQFKDKLFDSSTLGSTPSTQVRIPITDLYMGGSTTSPKLISRGDQLGTSGARVEDIVLTNFVKISADLYNAELLVNLQASSLAMPIREPLLPLLIATDPASPAGNKKILSCGTTTTTCSPIDPARPWIKSKILCRAVNPASGMIHVYALGSVTPSTSTVLYRNIEFADDNLGDALVRYDWVTGLITSGPHLVFPYQVLDCTQPGADLKVIANNALNLDGC